MIKPILNAEETIKEKINNQKPYFLYVEETESVEKQ